MDEAGYFLQSDKAAFDDGGMTRRNQIPASPPSTAEVEAVCSILEQEYGSPRHGNPDQPLDDLVYVILSNRTTPSVARTLYSALRETFPTWDAVADAPESELGGILAPGGLSKKRTSQLQGIVKRLREDFGRATLDPLAVRETAGAEDYLTSLPGVSQKVARCVLMYAMDRPVLPVDVHVHRITDRLGWHQHRRADQSHETLERIVPPKLRYGFHVNCVAHGRAVCRSRRPACDRCALLAHCAFGRGRVGKAAVREGA